jgi:hypothetical protein
MTKGGKIIVGDVVQIPYDVDSASFTCTSDSDKQVIEDRIPALADECKVIQLLHRNKSGRLHQCCG